ncbi:VOC family protein [Clostridium felsineum]|uniref:VOC family protein n=1 Tax=Clostridium felsineum TaxID=36839 RepID=UPI00214D2A0D|nr:VOC family protein [Clostridium felsineum]MCR3760453.1 VOC family protein [Clostridium felsineum]
MAIQAYVNFNGNCREAVEFYAKVFRTDKSKIMLYGDMPQREGFKLDDKTKNLVLNAELEVKGSKIMFSDITQGMELVVGNNITLVVTINNIEETKSIFNKLKEEGTVVMELQETFWSKSYGYVIDKFGIGWQISYEDK